MKSKDTITNQLAVYQAKSGAIELKADATKETIWATQAQIADIFIIERSVVTKHIRNLFKDKELVASSVCAKIAGLDARTEPINRSVHRYKEYLRSDPSHNRRYDTNNSNRSVCWRMFLGHGRTVSETSWCRGY